MYNSIKDILFLHFISSVHGYLISKTMNANIRVDLNCITSIYNGFPKKNRENNAGYIFPFF